MAWRFPDQPRGLYEDGTFNRVPLTIGATRDEGWIYADRSYPAGLTEEEYAAPWRTEFGDVRRAGNSTQVPASDFRSPKHALSQLAGDVGAVCEARQVARSIQRTRTPVYLYVQREVAAVARDQVIHGIDRTSSSAITSARTIELRPGTRTTSPFSAPSAATGPV